MSLTDLVDNGIARQKQAADPDKSVWVSASAGSGKTRVLVERSLRLMLAGTPPEKILCITFTKAAAAEMANRLNATLGSWSVMDDARLAESLYDLMGRPATDGEAIWARRLFASVLDAPGGLKIQTIHSFCESVLGRFPLEARLSPNFEVMDERSAGEIMQIARDETLLECQQPENAALGAALRLLSEKVNEEGFSKLLKDLGGKRSQLLRLRAEYGGPNGVIRALAGRIGIDPELTEEHIIARACRETTFDGPALRRAVDRLLMGTVSDVKKAEKMAPWLLQPDRRTALFDEYVSAFFTNDGKIFSKLATKAVVDAMPEILDVMLEEAERLQKVLETVRKARVLTSTSALIRLGLALIDRYEAEKTHRGRLDYDDLILKTRDLLTGDGVAPWVMYKLDGGIEHILVDEAQDTSAAQWQVIAALAEEFFSGDGAVPTERTLFVVGDEKQSIYSFQGADPATFDVMRRQFEERARAAKKDWRNVPLDLSFRSTESVLDLVDRVFEAEEARKGLTASGDMVKHLVRRAGAAGLVEIWPTVKPPEIDAADPWEMPMAQNLDQNPAAELAKNIALQIKAWLDTGEILSATGRAIAPKDIMILVQSRNVFFGHVVRALKTAEIPVAGTDRMVLTEQLAVMDLLALARFVLLPEDDLNLAVILKSPFVGCDDNQLFELAYGRKGSLWRALRDNKTGLPLFDQARTFLSELLARADFVPVYEFFADILGRLGGRKKLLGRLGQEAADPIEEFLSLALNFQRTEASSLQSFLHWIDAGASEVKRDMEQGRNEVRVLTVHGSKGLQAPIVFLPDTCQGTRAQPAIFWTEEEAPFPLWPVKTDNDDALTARMRELSKERQLEEKKRLLYVALTRAEDRLYICGWEGKKKRPADCWYELIDPAFGEGVEEVKLPWGEVARRWSSGTVTERAETTEVVPIPLAPLPEWISRPAPDEPSPPRPLVPSRDEDETMASSPLGLDDGRRFHRGLLVHRLLETLPSIDLAARERAAKAWLSRPIHGLDEDRQAEILQETLAVINDPDFSAIFGPGSQAEVPISGVIEGRVLSGQIDRLLIGDEEILVIDYKTNRPSPQEISAVPALYIRQMSLYRRALSGMYPGKAVKCALLWTEGPHLMELPDALL
ncbi:double-strand break repair helicase AddA [Sneathiella sp. HT1-7]|uniref:double-strand break repair helicase AddA n=1 Tax=Sneathiella sp. HT1-7 TaxID=2887192 RepID=UPI001D149D5C|nr:double-strand break repair helicase AddA [Sneathiella sp. HT1-7]MCC3303901.1 double-strand break repair helicase AddA [Sneathiella sp. HT1-7]